MRTNGRRAHPLLEPPAHPCWLEVDLDAVASNVRAVARLVGPTTAVAAVVKADGYGLGAGPVAETAIESGASWLAVARVQEGVELRRLGLTARILNLAHTRPEEARTAVEHQITPTIADAATARAFADALPRGEVLGIHLKVDTGLSRFGAQPAELRPLLQTLRGLPNLRVDGFYSHFAEADEADRSFAHEQLARFFGAEREVHRFGHQPRLRHLANSAATLALPESRLDLVRIGITLSGHYPSADVPRSAPLRPAVSFKARVARVYELEPGASVGYNRTYISDRRIRAAVVPAGYADGLPRAHSNRGQVLIRGKRAPLIGRVSMDQCVVDVTGLPETRAGDEVVLIGRQGDDQIDLHEYAAWSDTIAHEALCRIGPRVPRYYRASGQIRHVGWLGSMTSNGRGPSLLSADSRTSQPATQHRRS
jgi:alanine racemase